MSKFNLNKFHRSFNLNKFCRSLRRAKTPEAADELFSALFALPAAEQEVVGKALESRFFSDSEELKSAIRLYGADAVKRSYERSYFDEGETLQGMQLNVKIALNTERLLGDKASPLLKAYVDAVDALTKEEYNDPVVIDRATMSAKIDTLAKSEDLFRPKPVRGNRNNVMRPS
jgi:hypothetical protein